MLNQMPMIQTSNKLTSSKLFNMLTKNGFESCAKFDETLFIKNYNSHLVVFYAVYLCLYTLAFEKLAALCYFVCNSF